MSEKPTCEWCEKLIHNKDIHFKQNRPCHIKCDEDIPVIHKNKKKNDCEKMTNPLVVDVKTAGQIYRIVEVTIKPNIENIKWIPLDTHIAHLQQEIEWYIAFLREIKKGLKINTVISYLEIHLELMQEKLEEIKK